SEPIVERRATGEQSERRRIDGPCAAVDLELEHVAQPPDPGTVGEFRECGFRIEARDESLAADVVGDKAGGKSDGAVGTKMDTGSRQTGHGDRARAAQP